MTTVKSKQSRSVDYQNSFLVYNFKSLKLVQISAMHKSHYNIWIPHKQNVREYNQEIPPLLLQFNPRHREEDQ